LKALASRFKIPVPTNLEECIRLHLKAGLISCGMLSTVLVSGIFDDCRSLTLGNLTELEKISAHNEKVFVFEDPQIFAAVLTRLKDEKFTAVCPINGHNAAFMYLLKAFKNTPVYYAGNMTYKGLELADKLCLEVENLIPWRYDNEDFEKILSCGSVLLNDERNSLSMHNEVFASVLSNLRKTGKTASSMPLVPFYADDIRISVQ
jgi:hypothetical protein